MFVFNLWFATWINKEPVLPQHIVATSVIVGGICLVVGFGSHSDLEYTFERIEELLVRPAFLIYTFTVLVIAAVLHGVSIWADGDESRSSIDAYSYVTVSAMSGSFSVVLSKSMAESLHGALSTGDANPLSVFLVVSWLMVVLWWLYRLNECLRRFAALFVVPLLHAVWLVCTVVSGGIFFEEFERLPGWRLGLFVLGTLILVIGVALMPSSSHTHQVETEDVDYWLPTEQDDLDELMSPGSPGTSHELATVAPKCVEIGTSSEKTQIYSADEND
eukprot:TRINITY_DN15406_c0_g1_i1.p1 TRINITY_DN15406_c0_g1~~TRINITY_DN15406_c0_g1_i1.p1  ORF type:complete len:275 (-),score=10.68 TRINITY_DN15406_c0_g1_i1:259-1083(-)